MFKLLKVIAFCLILVCVQLLISLSILLRWIITLILLQRRCEEQEDACDDSLPQDFINYWREHYKKVDEFVLREEEVLHHDLDKKGRYSVW